MSRLPSDAKARKAIPLATGLLDYFPDALMAVAELSRIGNEQHNPGEPMHWAQEKSADEADALVRHLIDRGKTDSDGVRHSTKVVWRALALLQREIEAEREGPPKPVKVKPWREIKAERALRDVTPTPWGRHFSCGKLHSEGDPCPDPSASDPCGRPDCEAVRVPRRGVETVTTTSMKGYRVEPVLRAFHVTPEFARQVDADIAEARAIRDANALDRLRKGTR